MTSIEKESGKAQSVEEVAARAGELFQRRHADLLVTPEVAATS